MLTKQQQSVIKMAKFIQGQTLLLLEKLNELDVDREADICEELHESAEVLYRQLLMAFPEDDGE